MAIVTDFPKTRPLLTRGFEAEETLTQYVAMAPVAVVAARRAKTAVEIPSAADVEMVFGGLRTDYQSVCVMSEKTLAEISQL